MAGMILKIIILLNCAVPRVLGMRFFLPMFGLLGFDYGIGFDRIQQYDRLKRCS